jgi:hypothetical protein
MTITELLDYAMCWHAQYIERIVPGRPIDGGYDEEVRQVRVRTEGCQVCLSDATRVTGLLLRIVKAVTDWGFSAAYGCYFGNNRIRS